MRFRGPGRDICVRKIRIPAGRRRMPALVLSPRGAVVRATGILWIHGGGYITGMKEMVYFSRAAELVQRFGAVVVSPGYRLAPFSPYPAAIDDCYAALCFLKAYAGELGVRNDQLDGGRRKCRWRARGGGVHPGAGYRWGQSCVSDAAIPHVGRSGHGKLPQQPRPGVEHAEEPLCVAVLPAGAGSDESFTPMPPRRG